MKILANKNNLYNSTQFLNRLYTKDYIDGAVFNLLMTKDGTIIIFNWVSSNDSNLANAQTKTFAQIQAEDVMTLEEALSYLKDTPKKIILNVIPNIPTFYTADVNSLEKDRIQNETYIKKIASIIKMYPQLDIYLASISNKLVYHMKKHITERKIGLVIYSEGIGYEDVDFYVFNSILYDIKTFVEQIKRKKEIMLYVSSSDDLNTIYQSVQNDALTPSQIEMSQSIYFITSYPELLHKLFQK